MAQRMIGVKNFLQKLRHILSGRKVSFRSEIKGKNIVLGENCEISQYSTLSTELGGRIVLGKNVKIRPYAQLLTYGGEVLIGDNVVINQFTVLYGHGGLRIGNNVQIATHSVLIPSNHNYSDINKPIKDQGVTNLGITINDDVWVGANVTILDGVTIDCGCVIGASTVVTKSVPEYSVFIGNPGRIIKNRRV
jgi:acetyltransferase-like isoleucine patch superfamily enzyme